MLRRLREAVPFVSRVWPQPAQAASTIPEPQHAQVDAQGLLERLKVHSQAGAQDLFNSMLLSECVYKLMEGGPDTALVSLQTLQSQFPPGLVTLQTLQCSLPHVLHRYLIARTEDCLLVSFAGTKLLAKDLTADVNVFQQALWPDDANTGRRLQELPSAHRGFLLRASAIPVQSLYDQARELGLRMVLCGHSLGGAVAALCTLRILRMHPSAGTHEVMCITFGSPAAGNEALVKLVQSSGWESHFHHVALAGDIIPRLWSLQASPQETAALMEEMEQEQAALDSQPTELGTPERAHSGPLASLSGSLGSRPVIAGLLDRMRSLRWSDSPPSSPQIQSRKPPQLDASRFRPEQPDVAPARPEEQPDAAIAQSEEQPGGGAADHAGAQQAQDLLEAEQELVRLEQAAEEAAAAGPGHSPPGKSVKAQKAKLGQLQKLARFAQHARGGVRSRVWPTFQHFGKQHVWSPVGDDSPPTSVMALPWATIQALRSSLSLAPHRMTAYRMHALALCAAAGLPFPDPLAPPPQAPVQAGPVVPPLWAQQVLGLMSPLPPQVPMPAAEPASGGSGTSASWRLWNRPAQPGSSLAADVPISVTVSGLGLGGCSHARVCMPEHTGAGFKSPWMGVSLLLNDNRGHRLARPSQQGGVLGRIAQAASPRAMLNRAVVAPDPFAQPPQRLQFSCPLSLPLARHLAHTAAPLVVQLRSDFEHAQGSVALGWPAVWVLHHPPPLHQTWLQKLYRSVAPPPPLPVAPQQPTAFQDGVVYHDLSHAPLPAHAPALAQELLQQHASPAQSVGLPLPSLLLVQHEGHAANSAALRHLAQSAQAVGCRVLVTADRTQGSIDVGSLAGSYGVGEEHVLRAFAQHLTVSQLGLRDSVGGELQQEAMRVREAVYWMLINGSLSPRAKL